jgi:hypothetical protein
MNLDRTHSTSALSPASAPVFSAASQDENQDDDLFDVGMSQFINEIEHDLSSASPAIDRYNGTNDPDPDEMMDIDSEEEVKLPHVNKAPRRVPAKEYFDPELFGLRRSVCAFSSLYCCGGTSSVRGLIWLGSCADGT